MTLLTCRVIFYIDKHDVYSRGTIQMGSKQVTYLSVHHHSYFSVAGTQRKIFTLARYKAVQEREKERETEREIESEREFLVHIVYTLCWLKGKKKKKKSKFCPCQSCGQKRTPSFHHLFCKYAI